MKKNLQIILIFLLIGCQNENKKTAYKSNKLTTISETQKPTRSGKIKFLETQKTLNKQLEKFIGKAVFIDTWFTSCGSCIKQFKYTKKLEHYFNENDIVSLYICFGKNKDTAKWKELIYQYQLTGYHVFLESENIAEYKKNFRTNLKKSLFHGAPRYMIIDKKGKLVDGFAPRPIEKQKLINVISRAL